MLFCFLRVCRLLCSVCAVSFAAGAVAEFIHTQPIKTILSVLKHGFIAILQISFTEFFAALNRDVLLSLPLHIHIFLFTSKGYSSTFKAYHDDVVVAVPLPVACVNVGYSQSQVF